MPLLLRPLFSPRNVLSLTLCDEMSDTELSLHSRDIVATFFSIWSLDWLQYLWNSTHNVVDLVREHKDNWMDLCIRFQTAISIQFLTVSYDQLVVVTCSLRLNVHGEDVEFHSRIRSMDDPYTVSTISILPRPARGEKKDRSVSCHQISSTGSCTNKIHIFNTLSFKCFKVATLWGWERMLKALPVFPEDLSYVPNTQVR